MMIHHDWALAPAEHEINNYDKFKLRYRTLVESYIRSKPIKILKKRPFYTISTNVQCAVPATKFNSQTNYEHINVDHYQPLEISITKWNIMDARTPTNVRELQTKVWMINPGQPPSRYRSDTMKHAEKHKIDLDYECVPQHCFIESNLSKVMKEINSFLSPERLVFSTQLKHVRQDLGSLKWLACNCGIQSVKPIAVYDLVNLYVVLLRYLNPELVDVVSQSIAIFQMDKIQNDYALENSCDYHKMLADTGEEKNECRYCAKNMSIGWTNQLLDDVDAFTDIFNEPTPAAHETYKEPAKLSDDRKYQGTKNEDSQKVGHKMTLFETKDLVSELSNLII